MTKKDFDFIYENYLFTELYVITTGEYMKNGIAYRVYGASKQNGLNIGIQHEIFGVLTKNINYYDFSNFILDKDYIRKQKLNSLL
ncbi:hypothetical protein M0Q50_07925 [bacterium]|jgi:hypothetical protein|nr:hypothetical protein [bacterium]